MHVEQNNNMSTHNFLNKGIYYTISSLMMLMSSDLNFHYHNDLAVHQFRIGLLTLSAHAREGYSSHF